MDGQNAVRQRASQRAAGGLQGGKAEATMGTGGQSDMELGLGGYVGNAARPEERRERQSGGREVVVLVLGGGG